VAKPDLKLSAALKTLQRLQDKHDGVIESADLSSGERRLLMAAGFLRPVIKGWYLCANPTDAPGDSTVWFASFWSFLSGYLAKRFGKRYCLNPEASLLLHTGNTVVPSQVVIATKLGGNSVLELPHGTSLLLYQDEARVPKTRVERRGLQVFPLAEALCRVGPHWFEAYPRDAQIAIGEVSDVAELLSVLLEGEGLVSAAGRLAGALRFCGRGDDADRLLKTMRSALFEVRETNPFAIGAPTLVRSITRSPYASRIATLWAEWRGPVIDAFPSARPLPSTTERLLASVDECYAADAYNSLSIEGYQVSTALIERVAQRGWNPDEDVADRRDRDALAARGYYAAFQSVRRSIAMIVDTMRATAGDGPAGRRQRLANTCASIVRRDHHDWYAALFGPAVHVGILKAHQLAGYRTGPVYIRGSRHVPLPREAIADAMEALFHCMRDEPHPAARAVLAHHLFAFIHPYFDGNGRIARFLMNVLLVTGGYRWTVIRVAHRVEYMRALEAASVEGDIVPFARFLEQELRADAAGTNRGPRASATAWAGSRRSRARGRAPPT
jgi:hypothetical protein